MTGAPEILDGRVKTLHPGVHGGILARRDLPEHLATLAEHGLPPIDLVVVNLYPFEATLAAGADFAACIEQIDVGGPAMIRAAAKNCDGVAVIVEPGDYPALLAEIAAKGGTEAASGAGWRPRPSPAPPPTTPRSPAGSRARPARSSPSAWCWPARGASCCATARTRTSGRRSTPPARAPTGLAAATQLQGKELSFNNLNDTDTALALVAELTGPAVAIIKHANPCGVAVAASLLEAYRKALACDPLSAFGGIVACNRPLDEAAASEIARTFTEVVIAPGVDDAARAVFAAKPNLRLLTMDALPDPVDAPAMTSSGCQGGFLAQDRDTAKLLPTQLQRRHAARARPTPSWPISCSPGRWSSTSSRTRSCWPADGATVGIGMGQTSRVDAVHLAARRAAEHAGSRPCVVASDAFFPFADGLLAAIEAGATAAIQPGGSVRDAEVIAAADEAGIAMVFTGIRHFRH